MSSMKGVAYAVVTMYKMGTPVGEIQTMLDRMEFNQSKQEILAFINNAVEHYSATSSTNH